MATGTTRFCRAGRKSSHLILTSLLSDLVVRYVPLAYQPMDRRGGFRQARGVAQHHLEQAPIVQDHDAGAVAAHSLGQVAGDPPGAVDGMIRRDRRPLPRAVVIEPRG